MSGPDYMRSQRRRLNELSKGWAKRDGEPWSADEEDLLITDWIPFQPDERDEITISQVLERTIESCRVRCEIIRRRLGMQYTVRATTTTTTVEYRGLHDDPDDQWWSPDYYTQGR